jgi:hypothetical protein
VCRHQHIIPNDQYYFGKEDPMRCVYKTIAILIALSALPVHAVRTNGVDPEEKYIELGQEERFAAVGSVTHGAHMGTGTLIAPNIVLTSGHLFRSLLEDIEWGDDQDLKPITMPISGSHVQFQPEYNPLEDHVKYEVEAVVFDPYYMANLKLGLRDQHCFDYALLKLKTEVPSITPIPLFDIGVGMPIDGIFVGFGAGNTRENPRYVKRGALNSIQYHQDFSLFSALYYTPLAEGQKLSGFSSKIRDTNEGNRVWHGSQKPYGIGQAGDSGGPLLIKCQEKDMIIGVVVGGAHSPGGGKTKEIPDIKELDQDPFDPIKYYGNYRTYFSSIAYYFPEGGGFVRSSMLDQMQKAAAAAY